MFQKECCCFTLLLCLTQLKACQARLSLLFPSLDNHQVNLSACGIYYTAKHTEMLYAENAFAYSPGHCIVIVFEVSQLKGELMQLDNPGCGTYFCRLPSPLGQALRISGESSPAIGKLSKTTRPVIDLGSDKCVRIPLWEAVKVWLVQTSLATVTKSFQLWLSCSLVD